MNLNFLEKRADALVLKHHDGGLPREAICPP
jgi:hypothetical protein